MKTETKRFALLLSAALVILAALGLLLTLGGTSAAAQESRSEVYRRVQGQKNGYCDATAIPTDGLSMSVSVDMSSGSLGYVGIKPVPAGHGQPASGTRSIGILLYNSVDTCLAVEVYDGYVWQQLTNTTELPGISPSDRITLRLAKQSGVWGLYINGTLFTGRARSGIEGVAEGAVINPVAYIDESQFCDGGVSYFEIGTWEGGGSVSVYKQTSQGELKLYDRMYRPVYNARIAAAYGESGDAIALLESEFSDGRYSVSTLSGDGIAAFSVETAGGVRRTVPLAGETVIKDNDVALTVTDGLELMDGAEFSVVRRGEHIEDKITIERTGEGKYLLWDIGDAVSVTARRAGFAPQTAVADPDGGECVIALSPQQFFVTVKAFDAFAGEAVRLPKECVSVYSGGEIATDAEIIENVGETVLRGLSGRLQNHTVKITGLAGYAATEKAFDEFYAGGTLTVYVSALYDAKLTVKDENGDNIDGARVTVGNRTETAAAGVATLSGLAGDSEVTVRADGYGERKAIVTQKNSDVTVVLHPLGRKELRVDGAQDGATVRYTVAGAGSFSATVTDGKIELDESVQYGDELVATVDGYYVSGAVKVADGARLTVVKIHTVTLRFTHRGAPAANTRIVFDRAEAISDGEGVVRLDVTDFPLRILSAEGYASVLASEITLADGDAEVELGEKIYSASVTVVDGDGNRARGVSVTIGGQKTRKANGVYYADGLVGAQSVEIDGEVMGEVSETESEITIVLGEKKNEPPAPEPAKKKCGGSIGYGSVFGALACLITCAALTFRKRKERRQ